MKTSKYSAIFRSGVVAGAACVLCLGSASAPTQRGGQTKAARSNTGPVAHANRQVVNSSTRTQRTAPRPPQTNKGSSGEQQAARTASISTKSTPPARIGTGSRPTFDHSSGAPANRAFTRTAAGRDYDNGLSLHIGIAVSAPWQHAYFPGGTYYYPHYSNVLAVGDYISPFGFYFGVTDPYITNADCSNYPPADAYINVPLYNGANFSGWTDTDGNVFDDASLNATEPGLLNATDEISEGIQNGNIDAFASLVDPSMSIAIYTQGDYRYSMQSSDYLDLTRDTLASVKTVSLELNYLRQDSPTVYTLSGEQVYVGANGQNRGVYLSFVLQDIGGQWTLTQVGTSPDRIQAL